jgi:hypothetical protein
MLLILITALLIIPATAHARTPWSKDRTTLEVRRACNRYGISRTGTAWLQRAAVDIIYTGAHESSGRWWAVGGQHRGILQFTPSWNQNRADKIRHARDHGWHSDWRYCPSCSIYRFARVYKEGGRAKIEQHWKATLYR